MESLAFLVFVLFSALFLCGPVAIVLLYFKQLILASLLALISIWLGIFWFVHVYTWFRVLGLISAGCGLYVLWQTAERI